jgi:hypothetical protein
VLVLVGGVSQLYQGDLDLGRQAVLRLASEPLGPDVRVEDLHYGAVAVAQLLEELRPGALVLVGAEARGRRPGSVERRLLRPDVAPHATWQAAVADAVVGYVSVDLVVEVAAALGVLPPRTVTIEVEPAGTEPGLELTPAAAAGLDRAVALVRAEVRALSGAADRPATVTVPPASPGAAWPRAVGGGGPRPSPPRGR